MASPARLATAPAAQLALVAPEVFNSEFIERRLRQHNDWRDFAERVLSAGIIHEVCTGLFNQGPRLVGKRGRR